jgi:uncharacterized membrane protein
VRLIRLVRPTEQWNCWGMGELLVVIELLVGIFLFVVISLGIYVLFAADFAELLKRLAWDPVMSVLKRLNGGSLDIRR